MVDDDKRAHTERRSTQWLPKWRGRHKTHIQPNQSIGRYMCFSQVTGYKLGVVSVCIVNVYEM